MLHFIKVQTDFQDKNVIMFLRKKFGINELPMTPQYIKWTISNLLYQTRRKNPYMHLVLNYLMSLDEQNFLA